MFTSPAPSSIWPRSILVFFAVAILSLAIFITWAVQQNIDLVQPDYYAEEIRFQQQIERLRRTQPTHLQASIIYDSTRQSITVALPATFPPLETSGRIHLYRPSDAALDKNVKLALTADGRQHIDTRSLNAGWWKVRLYWTVRGEEFYSERALLISTNPSPI